MSARFEQSVFWGGGNLAGKWDCFGGYIKRRVLAERSKRGKHNSDVCSSFILPFLSLNRIETSTTPQAGSCRVFDHLHSLLLGDPPVFGCEHLINLVISLFAVVCLVQKKWEENGIITNTSRGLWNAAAVVVVASFKKPDRMVPSSADSQPTPSLETDRQPQQHFFV